MNDNLLKYLLEHATDDVVCSLFNQMMGEEMESERNDGDESCYTFNARERELIDVQYCCVQSVQPNDRRCEREADDIVGFVLEDDGHVVGTTEVPF